MRTVHISIRHDQPSMVSLFGKIKCFTVFFSSYRYGECRIDILDFLIIINLMDHGFLYVQDLTTQWQDRLEMSVTALFGSSTCGISLYKVNFRNRRVLGRTVCEFSRKSGTTHR